MRLSNNALLESVAAHTGSHLGQRLIANLGVEALEFRLCNNPNLEEALWDRLYEKHPGSSRSNLIANASTAKQARKILEEPEPYRRAYILKRGAAAMDPETRSLMIEYALAQSEADCVAACIAAGIVEEDTAVALWKRVKDDGAIVAGIGSVSFMELLEAAVSRYKFISNQLIIEMAEDKILDNFGLSRLIDYRPSLLNEILASNLRSNFYNAAAPARFLPDTQAHRVYLGLLNQREDRNPKYGLELLAFNPSAKRSTRLACFDILINEHSLGEYKNSSAEQIAKIANGVAPVRSDWASADEVELGEIKSSIRELGSSRFPTMERFLDEILPEDRQSGWVSRKYVESNVTPLLDSLGASGWDLFISLSEDWNSGAAELLLAVKGTSR